MAKAQPAGQLARWALKLQEYQFDIVYRTGTSNHYADCLSRIPVMSISHWGPEWTDWHEAQKGDETCKLLLNQIKKPVPPGMTEENKFMLLQNG
jgi:hypothetical protein